MKIRRSVSSGFFFIVCVILESCQWWKTPWLEVVHIGKRKMIQYSLFGDHIVKERCSRGVFGVWSICRFARTTDDHRQDDTGTYAASWHARWGLLAWVVCLQRPVDFTYGVGPVHIGSFSNALKSRTPLPISHYIHCSFAFLQLNGWSKFHQSHVDEDLHRQECAAHSVAWDI